MLKAEATLILTELHVLVLEDDAFQRRLIVGILQSMGVETVLQAENGRQALDIIHQTPSRIDVALCDLNMPEMDGMEFLRHLGKEHHNISVILTSALDEKLLASVGRMTRMYGVALLGVMAKPVRIADLGELLCKHVPSSGVVRRLSPHNFSLEDILQAVADDQFEPWFQPKLDMRSGRLVGAEALARWKHPRHGVVGPADFIPRLETTGNIDTLTFSILEKSVRACRALLDAGHAMTISVNLSPTSLDDTSLADRITRIVRQENIEPHHIMLEITESAAMTHVAPALENLARLCMNGFALSIDDYGTGSSNLEQLTRIAFSELKIDQSFVRDCAQNEAQRIVVESSIDIARKLNVTSVAEGIETRQDWETLRKAGCGVAQGYLVARPMDGPRFFSFADSHDPAGWLAAMV